VLYEQAAAAAEVQAEYEAKLAEHAKRVQDLKAACDEARREGRWLRWLGRAMAAWLAGSEKPRPPHTPTSTSREEAKLTARNGRELLMANHLDVALGDAWVLLRGYRNKGGEIDDILVGPHGVMAIEVKHRSATVGCRGDESWFDKYDRGGKHVEQGERPGVGPICAGRLLAFNPARFTSEAAFARANGTAPQPASSGKTIRHRLSRGGDRQINSAINTIALSRSVHHTQPRLHTTPNHRRKDQTRGHALTQETPLTPPLQAAPQHALDNIEVSKICRPLSQRACDRPQTNLSKLGTRVKSLDT
jgi:hypothetical protein